MAMYSTAASWRDWTNLSDGPARLIADRLLAHDVADYVRFRAVCAAWRASSDDPRGQSVFDRKYHPHRWLNIRPYPFFDRPRRLLNVSTGECINTLLPCHHHCFVLGPTAEGLLVLCRKDTLVVQLLNLFTGQITDLPHADTLINLRAKNHQSTASRVGGLLLLSAGLADDSTVVLLFREPSVPIRDDIGYCLAFARPGGKNWRRIYTDDSIVSALPFAGRIYCATTKKIMVVKITADKQPQLVTAAYYEFGGRMTSFRQLCLVDNDGVLLLVAHYTVYVNVKPQRSCKVYRVDLNARKTVAVPEGIVERAIFISLYGDRALSVRAGLSPSISGNTIYICKHQTDNVGPTYDVYSIVDGSIAEDCRTKPACSIVDNLTRYILGYG